MKVFCVGLSNTGTTSLTVALRTLGFDAVHWHLTRHAYRYEGAGVAINWPLFERYDAFADTPVARIFRELDAAYLHARFIFLSLPVPAQRFPRHIDPAELREGVGYRVARMPRRLLRRLRAAVH